MSHSRAPLAAALVLLASGCAMLRPSHPTPPGPSATPAPPPVAPAAAAGSDAFLLTIFLRHDQSKTLEEINAHLDRTGFHRQFPPEGCQVVSWYVMMGIGQVVTLRVPPDKLRSVNLAIERAAWGAFHTEFYPTYDFIPVWKDIRTRALSPEPAH
ncbi:hypothetical protein [Archangium lansingense]|uniref:Lipoprotein n=1 Tax=Archangium lansingense TaxID=2995310 RepID=A0ABT4AGL2_9BACT|nr:hypothetical protein [Archangium lansinium]MCY1080002.1 hypothetical protein [Archangium lansinium]